MQSEGGILFCGNERGSPIGNWMRNYLILIQRKAEGGRA